VEYVEQKNKAASAATESLDLLGTLHSRLSRLNLCGLLA